MEAGLTALVAFLRREAALAFVWGRHDCALFLADWIVAAGRADPAREWRGAYASEADCVALWGRGFLRRLVGRAATGAGLARTVDPNVGDIALVGLKDGRLRVLLCAIRVHEGWVMRGEQGLTRLPAAGVKAFAAWEIAPRASSEAAAR